MESKKILFFSLSLKKGGAENQLSKLALFLQNNTGFDVSIIYFVKGNDFEKIFEQNKISYTYLEIKKIGEFFKLINYIKELKPSLLISFMFGANIIARLIKLFFQIPLITSVRNNEISGLYRFIYRLTYKLDNTTTFNSQYALEKFIKEKLTLPKKSLLINNAVTVKKSEYVEKNNQVFTMISLAHFRPQKDYLTLFKAVSLLKKENILVKLFVLGHLYDQDWPLKTIKELGIEEEVDIVGFTLDTQKYLNQSDVLVLSSLWEGTPNAILEGMANHLPILASDIPGSFELVTNAKCGELFEAKNVIDLKNKIVKMINFPEDYKGNLGNDGYNYIMKHFEENMVYKQWLNIINNNIK